MPVDFCIRTTESVTQQGRVEYDFMRSQSAPARVLIVDDDERERLELTDVVSSLGYVVESAEDGEQALEKLGSSEVDAIVTDLIMPRVDGFTLLRTLLDRGDLTPAVVLTGFGGVREYARGHEGGGDIDSGPVLFGVSVSATGFALAGARASGDRGLFTSLYRTAELFGVPVDRGAGRRFATGGPLGNALLLAMMTAERWP